VESLSRSLSEAATAKAAAVVKRQTVLNACENTRRGFCAGHNAHIVPSDLGRHGSEGISSEVGQH
jgi:hypothetical protein